MINSYVIVARSYLSLQQNAFTFVYRCFVGAYNSGFSNICQYCEYGHAPTFTSVFETP